MYLIFIACFYYYYSQRLEIRAQVADAFLSKFQLTSDEMSVLRGTREGPITEVCCFCYNHWKCSSYRCYTENFKALFYHLKMFYLEIVLNLEIKMHILNCFNFFQSNTYTFLKEVRVQGL